MPLPGGTVRDRKEAGSVDTKHETRTHDAPVDGACEQVRWGDNRGRDSACRAEPSPVKQELTVGEVAKRSGIAVSAVHFYEAKGLIKSRRSQGNHRLYPREVLRRIAVIKVAQRTGLSLEEIRSALATLPGERAPTKADWTKLSEAWKAELEERIARLMRLRDQLDRCIGCGCLSISDCPLRNPADRLAAEGPGPRLLDPDPGPRPFPRGASPNGAGEMGYPPHQPRR